MTPLPANLEDVLVDLRPAAHRVAARGRRHQRVRVLVIAVAALGLCAGVALAASHYLGQPAPSFLKAELAQYDKGVLPQYRLYPNVAKAEVVATNGHAVLYAATAAPRGPNPRPLVGSCSDLVADGAALGWSWACRQLPTGPYLGFNYAPTDPRRHLRGLTLAGHVVVRGARALELHYRGGVVDRILLGLRGFYVFDVPAAHLPLIRRGPLYGVVRGAGDKALYRERLWAPIEPSFQTAPGDLSRVTRITGRVQAAPGGQLQLYFDLVSNHGRPVFDANGKEIDTSGQALVQLGPDGRFSYAVPTAWQRYVSVGYSATSHAHPYLGTGYAGAVAGGYAPPLTFWPAREKAFRSSNG